MTKAEELKLLEQIEELINTADVGDYIPMTFAGIVEVCRRNIEDDFGDSPVEDCANMRVALDAERRAHEETKRMLADAQKALKEALDLNDRMRKTADEWEKNAHDAGEMYCGLEAECAELSAKNRKLKAEIVRMRMERMTEDDMALMYDRMRGDFDD